MKIENFCNLGAALQTQTTESLKQPQVYFYRSLEDTIPEMLTNGYFDALERRVQKNDFMILYHPIDGENKRQIIFTKVISNNGGAVRIEPCNISAEEVFVDPSWSHLLPDTIPATNLKDYISAIEDSLNTKQHQLTAGRSIILQETGYQSDIAVDVDDAFSTTSKNPPSNDIVTAKFNTIDEEIDDLQEEDVKLHAEIADVAAKTLSFMGYVGTTDPSTLSLTLMEGNMWINSATLPTTFPVSASSIKIWTEGAWENATEGYTPAEFDTFRSISDMEGRFWFGGDWNTLSTDLSLAYFSLNSTTGKWEIKTDVNLPGLPTTSSTPTNADNSKKIANTEWFNNKWQKVNALPATPDPDVFYYIEEEEP